MFVNEQGSHFNEKVTFDKIKKTVTFHVPAHRDISESDFMVDFQSVSIRVFIDFYYIKREKQIYDNGGV